MPRYGQGRRRRGRCRGQRWIERPYNKIHPIPTERKQIIILKLYELEALRLVDLKDLTQEEAAAMMGVSRKTLWNDLHKARKKVTNALVKGYQICIENGNCIPRINKEVKKEDASRR